MLMWHTCEAIWVATRGSILIWKDVARIKRDDADESTRRSQDLWRSDPLLPAMRVEPVDDLRHLTTG